MRRAAEGHPTAFGGFAVGASRQRPRSGLSIRSIRFPCVFLNRATALISIAGNLDWEEVSEVLERWHTFSCAPGYPPWPRIPASGGGLRRQSEPGMLACLQA